MPPGMNSRNASLSYGCLSENSSVPLGEENGKRQIHPRDTGRAYGVANPRKNWSGRRATGRNANAQAGENPSSLSNIGETEEAVSFRSPSENIDASCFSFQLVRCI